MDELTDVGTRATSTGAGAWTATMERLLPVAAVVGPALMLLAAAFVALDVQTMAGELDWISEPEAFFGYVASIFLIATWIVIGRAISTAAPRTGVAVTLLGVVGAIGYTNPFVSRLMSIDLVEFGFDPDEVDEVWDNPSLFSALTLPIVFCVFLVAIVAGIAVLTTKVSPAWTGIALIASVPVFIMAQAGYVAIRVTYPIATALLLGGVAGVVTATRPTTS